MFLFEFDEAKSQANFSKHGINFIDAQMLWHDPRLLEIPAKTEDEPRYLVWTYRGKTLVSRHYLSQHNYSDHFCPSITN